jgi:hypothetical protein
MLRPHYLCRLASELRGPHDVINLASLFGLSQKDAKDAITANPQQVSGCSASSSAQEGGGGGGCPLWLVAVRASTAWLAQAPGAAPGCARRMYCVLDQLVASCGSSATSGNAQP